MDINIKRETDVKKLMPCLLILFVLSNLMVQAFVTVSPSIASHFNISTSTVSIQVTITTIVLGVCSVVYGALSDYIPVKKLLLFGISALIIGSILGFTFQENYFMVVIARAIQTLGQAAISSLYLVITSRYLNGSLKIKYFAYFTACFQIAQAAGVTIGGLITTYISWQYLLLIPLTSIVFIPTIIKCTPNDKVSDDKGEKIDILGLSLFSGIIVFLTLLLNSFSIFYLVASLVLSIIFALYIVKNDKAFITPKFFKENKKYVLALMIVVSIYVVQFAFSFIYTFVITEGYKESLAIVSYILLPGYISAAIVGGVGDKIAEWLGEANTIFLGMFLILSGLFLATIFIGQGKLTLSIAGILFYVGFNILYSPLINTVTNALPANEVGRGIGLNDLSINISASIGVAVCAKLMTFDSLEKLSIFGSNISNLNIYQNIFLLLIAFVIFAICLFRSNKNILTV